MSFITILLIASFTNSIHSSISKSSTDVIEPLYNVSLLRHKRAHTEYTRWRPNQLTTQEFIVKVFDDDIIPTTTSKEVVAVNILSTTRDREKIIVGGVVVPSPSTALTAKAAIVSKVPMYPAKALNRNDPPYPHYKFGMMPQRDESPPASPQFVARTPGSRQYAPITPVLFSQRSTFSHVTPSTAERRTLPDLRTRPSRTSPSQDVMALSRTLFNEDEFAHFNAFEDEDLKSNQVYVSRSSLVPTLEPERTKDIYNMINVDDALMFSSKFVEHTRTTEIQKLVDEENKKGEEEKEIDSAYILYNEEDNENTKTENKHDKDELGRQSNETLDENTSRLDTTENGTLDRLNENEVNNELKSEIDSIIIVKDNETKPDSEPDVGIVKTSIYVKHNCSLLQLRPLNFKSPRTLPEIVAQIKHWAETSPIAKLVDITSGNFTLMDNPIYMMIVDDPSSGQIVSAKQTVMVIAGIQGRDHHAVSAALYVLYQLIEHTDVHSELLSKYRFWIIPVFNPDGYEYSITFPQRREWTKNLRQTWEPSTGKNPCAVFGLRCSIKPCYGVNLDRNFEYQWIPPEELRAEHPCGELYAGSRQLSEEETVALTHYLHTERAPIHTFVAFKEGDVLGIMYPYSHTKKPRAFDHVYRQRASRAASAAYGISGRPYVAGQTSQFLPLYAGGIEDWVDGHLGIDNTYTVMMFRPTDSYNSKYVTERVVHEAYAALDTLLLHSMELTLGPPAVTLTRSKGILRKPHPIAVILCSSMLTIITHVTILIRI